ncbi:MAG: hypothetical protein GEV07_06415 [Streptosporangiales bacterium]|nr:hypothetical protein [Streptosporangiales bacterium]
MLRLSWFAAAAVVATDLVVYVVALADTSLLVSAGSVLFYGVAVATGPALLTGAEWLLARGRGRGSAALLVGVGVVGGGYLLLLTGLGLLAPVCDFGNGDACAYGTAGAPLWYVLPRTVCILAVAAGTLGLLAGLGRTDTGGSGPPVAPALASFAVSAGCGLAICAVNLPATAERLATGVADSQFLIDEAASDAYTAAGWLTGTAAVLVGGVVFLALLARHSGPRRGAAHVFGGLLAFAQLAWTYTALAANPVGWQVPNRFHLVSAPLPSWYPPTLATLVVLALVATLAGTVLLLAAGRRRGMADL